MTLANIYRGNRSNKLGLMAHLVLGYPNPKTTLSAAKLISKLGVDLIELQIPFSDPIADGPVIMRANDIALRNGMNIKSCLKLTAEVSKKCKKPIILMTYFNRVANYGIRRFCMDAKKSGATGLIVPDMAFDEEKHEHLIHSMRLAGLLYIPVISTNITSMRLAQLNKFNPDIIYCTARLGTTGSETKLDKQTIKKLKQIRKATDKPLAVGFGISKTSQLMQLSDNADFAVIGSAIVNKLVTGKLRPLEDYLRILLKVL